MRNGLRRGHLVAASLAAGCFFSAALLLAHGSSPSKDVSSEPVSVKASRHSGASAAPDNDLAGRRYRRWARRNTVRV